MLLDVYLQFDLEPNSLFLRKRSETTSFGAMKWSMASCHKPGLEAIWYDRRWLETTQLSGSESILLFMFSSKWNFCFFWAKQFWDVPDFAGKTIGCFEHLWMETKRHLIKVKYGIPCLSTNPLLCWISCRFSIVFPVSSKTSSSIFHSSGLYCGSEDDAV